jgi:hypothetical protein
MISEEQKKFEDYLIEVRHKILGSILTNNDSTKISRPRGKIFYRTTYYPEQNVLICADISLNQTFNVGGMTFDVTNTNHFSNCEDLVNTIVPNNWAFVSDKKTWLRFIRTGYSFDWTRRRTGDTD